ncbi:RdgB/HAM1 family non-canonical purine NTP pyrophosphatase [Mycoplasma putrefaciens]|uniref:dITP/XTP pyrophosphatase n=1 Tax=Mycoplasma putrefaciens (strain ATCC 15718 / NCTC 10155 / C30 KS-1 / KS-1) TaxID=743965 RepID=A0A7U3ZSG1_MYCPK|nr:RdgB/HAM1 family non-canonical purine NTP pyrophosphatase [Mycoplasma putrefaciens]AEM68675.1 Nucleoside-triphosphatase [Mycoplasma putrefaciens KS1]
MTKKIIWIATNSKNKAQEYQEILKDWTVKTLLDLKNYQEIAENGSSFEQNAMIKAKALAKQINGIAIGDDTGICVKVLDDFPGIYSKRWAYPITDHVEICQKLLEKLKPYQHQKQRKAKMVTAIAFYDAVNDKELVFSATVEGYIANELRLTSSGFGYDYIFIPKNSNKTYSEMTSEQKNNNSARRQAIDQFCEFISNY